MEFSWDEAKREWVLAERGIDFLRVAFALFDGRPLLTVPTPWDHEERLLSIGLIEGKFFAVVWTLARRCRADYHSQEGER
jgi:uncharacterized protein